MLYSVEQAFVGRDEIRAPLENACVGGLLKPCHRVINKDLFSCTQYWQPFIRSDREGVLGRCALLPSTCSSELFGQKILGSF